MLTATTLGWYNKQAMLRTGRVKLEAEQVKHYLNNIFGAHLAKMDLGLRGYAITQEAQLLIPYAEAVKETETTMRKLDSLLRVQNLDTSVVALANFGQNLNTYLEHCEKMKQEAKAGNLEAFKSLLKADKGFGLWKSYEKFLFNHVAYEDSVIKQAEADYSAAMNSNLIVLAMLLGIGLPTLLLLLRRLKKEGRSRQQLLTELEENNQQYLYHPGTNAGVTGSTGAREVIAQSIDNFKQASVLVKAMASGDYQVNWEGLGAANMKLNQHTLAGELLRMREQLRESKESDEKRNWANEGLHQFSLLVHSQQSSSDKLCYESIRFLTKHLAAQQGSLFTMQRDEKEAHLTLTACYAFDRRKYLEKRIEVGSGLVGQCYLEGETILLTEVPQGYTFITSGLGDATPTCILIVPIKHNDHTEAILELAGFVRFADHQITFLEKAGEYLASTLAGLKTTTYMQQLLNASQQQAQELRTTEEEMRQNMEEFSATQEEMRRQQQAHLLQIEQLEALQQAYLTRIVQLEGKQ